MNALGWNDFDWESVGQWFIQPSATSPNPVGIAIDTRELAAGQIFVAFKGERVDGHGYLSQASKKGAALCIVTDAERVPDGFDCPVLIVRDPVDAMTRLAAQWRSKLRATVVGVTGSNGKTTTARFIHAVLSQGGKTWVSSKSHNNAIGVPMSILNTPMDAQFAVFEIGTSSPGEIAARSSLVQPDISVITSIGRAHLEELGSLAGVCTEKASILAHTKAIGVIPAGNEQLDDAIDVLNPSCALHRFEQSSLKGLELGSQSLSFNIDENKFVVPAPGMHNAFNAAKAVLIGRECGMNDEQIAMGLANAKLPEMRLDRVEIPTNTDPIVLFNDAYNANPDSTRAALAFFESLNDLGTKVVVLGDMLELGESSESEHQSLVHELETDAVQSSIDRCILVGPEYARVAGDGFEVFPSIDDYAMTEIARTIKPGDVVLLKGSRGIGLERLVYILINRYTTYARAGQSARASSQHAGDESIGGEESSNE